MVAAPSVDGPPPVRTIALDGAPTVTIRQLGAALIEVSLGSDGGDEWKTLEIERRFRPTPAADEVTQHDALTRAKGAAPRAAIHTAQPGVSYAYRARVAGEWSEPVTLPVTVPKAPPPAPTSLSVRAESPFATRITWQAETSGVAGFEVFVDAGKGFVRAALLNPTERELVHHRRLPGEQLKYRVRAFNSAGTSASLATASITLPERAGGVAGRRAKLGPCITPKPVVPKTGGCNSEIEEIDAGDGKVLYNAPGADFACNRHLLGDYKGCRRELGVFQLQADVTPVAEDSEGWPLLHAIAGAGQYVGASILTLRFEGGRYSVVDEATFCGERPPDADDLKVGYADPDVARSFPPFEACQDN